jgi:hypothetical protein
MVIDGTKAPTLILSNTCPLRLGYLYDNKIKLKISQLSRLSGYNTPQIVMYKKGYA